jgi:hypothetical protein
MEKDELKGISWVHPLRENNLIVLCKGQHSQGINKKESTPDDHAGKENNPSAHAP